jgi:hypothetical protein
VKNPIGKGSTQSFPVGEDKKIEKSSSFLSYWLILLIFDSSSSNPLRLRLDIFVFESWVIAFHQSTETELHMSPVNTQWYDMVR